MSQQPPIIFDNGTGYSKIGFASSTTPLFTIPTSEHNRPLKHGVITDWDAMDSLWLDSYYKYLRALPSKHYTLLTESPLNPPKNRDKMAEIFFESYEVPGLYIGVQAVMALASSWLFAEKKVDKHITGTVIDIGDGLCHIVPIVDGYVCGSAVRQVPIAGKEITQFIQKSIKEREGPESKITMDTAQQIKEQLCYLSRDPRVELQRFSSSPQEFMKTFTGINAFTKNTYNISVGSEAFMAPEVFFDPSLISRVHITPLPALIGEVIQSCPIDCRRDLCKNIVLSGGSTCFKNFGKRLQRDLKETLGEMGDSVNVISHSAQRHAVFSGASALADLPSFYKIAASREDYFEKGVSCCRFSPLLDF